MIGCLAMATVVTTAQQIPNNGFEDWTTTGNYEMPDFWDNLNPTTDPAGIYTCTKGTPGSPGTAFLNLTSTLIPGTGVVPAVAVCGVLDQSTRLPVSGFAFEERPEKFTGKWQYMMFGTGKGFMDILLTKWNAPAGKRDTVAYKHHVLSGMVMSWGSFSIPLIYKSGSFPDSCIIFLSASGSVPADFDYLWLDNLAFTGSVITAEPRPTERENELQAFPNPASSMITLRKNMDRPEKVLVRLLNMNGREVKEYSRELISGTNDISIFTEGLRPGSYMISIRTSTGEETKQIIIQ
jgi:hypothetical protein